MKSSLVALGLTLAVTIIGHDTANAQASSDGSGTVAGQAKSGEPCSGAGSVQLPSPNSEDQGGTGVKGSVTFGHCGRSMMPRSLCDAIEMYGYPALPIGRFRTCPQVGRRGVI